jgi:hypothetical protein
MAERRAVVVGINKYDDPLVTPALEGAENDAREVYARLKEFGQFSDEKMTRLLIGKDATSDAIREAISDLFWKKDKCDVAFFYFSGHGFQDDYGNGFIAPWDYDYENPLVRGIRMQELREFFLAGNNNKTESLLILDCCHSGMAADPTKQKGSTPVVTPFLDPLVGKQPAPLGTGKFILASSGANETSRERKCRHKIRLFDDKKKYQEYGMDSDDTREHDHGIMTFHLLEGMDGEAAEGNEVKIGRLYDYVKRKVAEYKKEGDKNFKIYDSVSLTYDKGEASQTMLVMAGSKGEFDNRMQLANEQMAKVFPAPPRRPGVPPPQNLVYPAPLLFAIRLVDRAMELSPDNSDATNLVVKIDAGLQDHQGYLDDWLLDNRIEYGASYREEFTLLDDVASGLSFGRLRKLDQRQSSLVGTLMQVALKQANEKPLKAALANAPFSQALQGAANAAPAAGGAIQ